MTQDVHRKRDPKAYKAPEPKKLTPEEERALILWKAGTRHERECGA